MKEFFISEDAKVSRHKIRNTEIVGHGILHPEQNIVVFTTYGRAIIVAYDEIKVGTHYPSDVILLNKGEKIKRIDIVTVR